MELHAACGSVTVLGCSAAVLGAVAAVGNVSILVQCKNLCQEKVNFLNKQQGIIISGGLLSHLLIIIVTFFSPYSPAVRCGLYSTVYSVQQCTVAGGAAAETRAPAQSVAALQSDTAVTEPSRRYSVTSHTSHVTHHTSGG